ncbi:unnamed protein product [Ambrosiozyma monospora]|uniref:Unnamed protein product n=1 Tax=Ambrosiozyma monospora TaxID=43982 RepID=A0ACB5T4T9_AMBMO|nr:unnamed protein product [Ambrosiozyma monospora]
MSTQTATLKLQAEIPLDKQVEQIIKSNRGIASNKNENVVYGPDPEGLKILPPNAKKRLEEGGVDLSKGYPERPSKDVPIFLDEGLAIRDDDYPYIERGKNADPEKKALFGAAKEVIHLTKHIEVVT